MAKKSLAREAREHKNMRLEDIEVLFRAYQEGVEIADLQDQIEDLEERVKDAQASGDKAEARYLQEELMEVRERYDALDEAGYSFMEYGLSFDYVPGNTDYNPDAGYFRYQLSWGGPSEEFRFYTDPQFNVHTIEFWYLVWFDGKGIELTGDDFQLMEEIFEFFNEVGVVESEYEKEMGY